MRPARASGPAPKSIAQETPAPRSRLTATRGRASTGCASLAQAHEELPRPEDEDHRPEEAMQAQHEVRVVLGADPPSLGEERNGYRQVPAMGRRPCALRREHGHRNME